MVGCTNELIFIDPNYLSGSQQIGKYEGIKSESFQFIFYILSLAKDQAIGPICLKLIFPLPSIKDQTYQASMELLLYAFQ